MTHVKPCAECLQTATQRHALLQSVYLTFTGPLWTNMGTGVDYHRFINTIRNSLKYLVQASSGDVNRLNKLFFKEYYENAYINKAGIG